MVIIMDMESGSRLECDAGAGGDAWSMLGADLKTYTEPAAMPYGALGQDNRWPHYGQCVDLQLGLQQVDMA